MLLNLLRLAVRNLGTFFLAFLLAVVVWVSAVVTADPNEERTFTRPLTVIGQDPGLMMIGSAPTQVRITLNAPRSRLNQVSNNPALIEAWLDLAGVKAGKQRVPVNVSWALSPVRLVRVEPESVEILLEAIVSRSFPVVMFINGDPPLGYSMGEVSVSPDIVNVTGPESKVSRINEVHASLDIQGVSASIHENVTLEAVDDQGNPVTDVTLVPKSVTVNVPISLLGGFKNEVVKVVTKGQVARGYRLTNISVTPPTVTIFSSDPNMLNDIPGYVETDAVDLNGLEDDLELRVALDLPHGVALVGEQSVLVQVGVAAIEGSLTLSLPIEAKGLPPDLLAKISPATLDVILTGPLPILETLNKASLRFVVDLTNLLPGNYQIAPLVDLVPPDVSVESILPETVEVEILPASTTTPGIGTPTLSPGLVLTPTPPVAATPTGRP